MSVLKPVLDTARVVVCVGSGGVGKTTTASALGVAAAAAGRRTLVVTIDPARRLADALGLDALEHAPRAVSPDLLAQAGMPGADLSAMMLDVEAAWDDMVHRLSPPGTDTQAIVENRFYQHMSRELPGAQEFIACEALQRLVDQDQWDLIILDTPPAANALDFFDAPDRILSVLDHEAFQSLTRGGKGRFGLRFLDTAGAAAQMVLSRITGPEFLDELGAFLALLGGLYAPLSARTKAFSSLLATPEARFVVVTSPAPGPLSEAAAFHTELVERGFHIDSFIANRTQPVPAVEPDAPSLEHLADAGLPDALVDAVHEALEEQCALAAADRDTLCALAAAHDTPVVVVPELSGTIHDVSGLRRLEAPLLASSLLASPLAAAL